MLRRLIRAEATQAVAAWLLGQYLALVFATTRWRLVDGAPLAQAAQAGRPVIVAFWHERLPMIARLRREVLAEAPGAPPIVPRVLVSQHRDGRFIGRIVGRFGLEMAYGSSRRGGAQGLLDLVRETRGGGFVVITPDGPRGPRRVAQPGVAHLAALSGAPVVPVSAATTRLRALPSWDRMLLPLPFARGVIVCGPPIAVARGEAEAALPGIAAALTEACERADALVAAGR